MLHFGRRRSNPSSKEVAKIIGAGALGAAVALAMQKFVPVKGPAADAKGLTPNQKAAVIAVASAAIGGFVSGKSPAVGGAIAAGGLTVAGQQALIAYAAREVTAPPPNPGNAQTPARGLYGYNYNQARAYA